MLEHRKQQETEKRTVHHIKYKILHPLQIDKFQGLLKILKEL